MYINTTDEHLKYFYLYVNIYSTFEEPPEVVFRYSVVNNIIRIKYV